MYTNDPRTWPDEMTIDHVYDPRTSEKRCFVQGVDPQDPGYHLLPRGGSETEVEQQLRAAGYRCVNEENYVWKRN